MTREQIKSSRLLLVEIFTGSKKYNLNDDESDVDIIGVFEKNPIIEDLNLDYFVDKGNRYYSLDLFCKLLYDGDLIASEIINSDYKDFRFLSGPYQSNFVHTKLEIVNKKAISNWIRNSSILFNKSVRLGKLKLNKPQAVDFCSFLYWSVQDLLKKVPLKNVLDTKNYNNISNIPSDHDAFLSRMALEKSGFPNIYKLFHAYTDNRVPGLLDANNQIIENGLENIDSKNSLGFKGIVHYDKKNYLKYLRFYNNLNGSNIVNGYSTKYMTHAFRYLYTALHALSSNKFLTVLPEAPFLKRIKNGEESLTDLIPKYKELAASAENLLEKCDYTYSLHPNTLRSMMLKCKYQIENINEFVI